MGGSYLDYRGPRRPTHPILANEGQAMVRGNDTGASAKYAAARRHKKSMMKPVAGLPGSSKSKSIVNTSSGLTSAESGGGGN